MAASTVFGLVCFFGLMALVNAGVKCPGSQSFIHAGMELTALANASCAVVEDEAKSRVAGQYSAFHDPHNNGTYFPADLGGDMSFSRATASATGGKQPFPVSTEPATGRED